MLVVGGGGGDNGGIGPASVGCWVAVEISYRRRCVR